MGAPYETISFGLIAKRQGLFFFKRNANRITFLKRALPDVSSGQEVVRIAKGYKRSCAGGQELIVIRRDECDRKIGEFSGDRPTERRVIGQDQFLYFSQYLPAGTSVYGCLTGYTRVFSSSVEDPVFGRLPRTASNPLILGGLG
jgi:hypothetical protein